MAKYFNSKVYYKANINDLIIFAIYLLSEHKEKSTFERILKECFDLFPKVFSFSKYSKWPDSRKLDRPLRFLRKEKMIKKESGETFSLTKKGNSRAGEIAKLFSQKGLFE